MASLPGAGGPASIPGGAGGISGGAGGSASIPGGAGGISGGAGGPASIPGGAGGISGGAGGPASIPGGAGGISGGAGAAKSIPGGAGGISGGAGGAKSIPGGAGGISGGAGGAKSIPGGAGGISGGAGGPASIPGGAGGISGGAGGAASIPGGAGGIPRWSCVHTRRCWWHTWRRRWCCVHTRRCWWHTWRCRWHAGGAGGAGPYPEVRWSWSIPGGAGGIPGGAGGIPGGAWWWWCWWHTWRCRRHSWRCRRHSWRCRRHSWRCRWHSWWSWRHSWWRRRHHRFFFRHGFTSEHGGSLAIFDKRITITRTFSFRFFHRQIILSEFVGTIMVGLDASNPPVLFIVGTAGAGKSSLVTSFQRWSRFLETEVIAVNLDPGAERVHYDAEFDVRDLISLSEVMDEYDLGPNGAQILAADLVAAQASEVAEELHAIAGDLVVVDTPGQVELFAFREASNHLIEVLGRDQAAIIYLFDPMLSKSPSGFVSQMLLSSIVEFRLGLPTKNVLSKSDLLSDEELEQIIEWSERLEILEFALYNEAGGQRTEFAINQLRMLQDFAQQPGLIPLSSEMEDGLADILTFAQALFGGMADARDGFAPDIEHEID